MRVKILFLIAVLYLFGTQGVLADCEVVITPDFQGEICTNSDGNQYQEGKWILDSGGTFKGIKESTGNGSTHHILHKGELQSALFQGTYRYEEERLNDQGQESNELFDGEWTLSSDHVWKGPYEIHTRDGQVTIEDRREFVGPEEPEEPVDPSTYLSIEAESGSLTSPMKITSDASASNSAYISVPDGSGGAAVYAFTVEKAGNYVIWGRTIAPKSNADSFYVSVDGAKENLWDVARSSDWAWDQVKNRNGADPVIVSLTAGSHTLKIRNREDGTKIDKILITDNLSYIPQGAGN